MRVIKHCSSPSHVQCCDFHTAVSVKLQKVEEPQFWLTMTRSVIT